MCSTWGASQKLLWSTCISLGVDGMETSNKGDTPVDQVHSGYVMCCHTGVEPCINHARGRFANVGTMNHNVATKTSMVLIFHHQSSGQSAGRLSHGLDRRYCATSHSFASSHQSIGAEKSSLISLACRLFGVGLVLVHVVQCATCGCGD